MAEHTKRSRRNQPPQTQESSGQHKASGKPADNAGRSGGHDSGHGRPWAWTIAALAILASGLGLFWWLWISEPADETSAPASPLVRAATVDTAAQTTIRQTAFVRPRADLAITSEIQGRIASVSNDFAIGELVSEGTVLVTLETRTLEAGVAQAEANHQQAQAALTEAQATLQRQQTLAGEQVVSEATLEDARVGLQSAQANVASARASLMQARDSLEDAQITAPFDALVTSEAAAVGKLVQPGAALGRLVDARAVRLQMGLTPSDLFVLGAAEAGLGATVALARTVADKAPLGTGTVVGIDPSIVQATRTVALVIEVPSPFEAPTGANRARAVKINELVEVALSVSLEGSAAFAVPPEAVKGQDALWRIADGVLSRIEIEVLYREEDRVLVTGDGITAGMQVMVSSLPAPLQGQKVRVADAAREGQSQ